MIQLPLGGYLANSRAGERAIHGRTIDFTAKLKSLQCEGLGNSKRSLEISACVVIREVVPEGGFEPPTPRFSIVCSTPELLGHCFSGQNLFSRHAVGEGAYGERQCDWQGLTSRCSANFSPPCF